MSISGNELSEREREILRLVATGASNKEIAQQLFISTNTVKVHLRNIFAKIGVTSRTEAAMYAVNAGLLATAPAGNELLGKPAEVNQSETQPADSTIPAILETDAISLIRRSPWWSYAFIGLTFVLFALLLYKIVIDRPPRVSESQTTAKWVELDRMPTARSGMAAAVFRDRIYAFGGENESGILNTVEVFERDIGKWSSLPAMPWGATDIQAAVIRNKIYLPGGWLASGDISSTLSIFDPQTGAWERGANLPWPVSRYGLAEYEDRLYLFGGWDGKQFLDRVLIYDPVINEWAQGTPMEAPRADLAATVVNEEVHLLGGINQKGVLNLHQVYSPLKEWSHLDPWREEGLLPESRSGMGATSVMDVIYLVGGQGEGKQLLSPLGLLTKTREWLKIPTLSEQNITGLRLLLLDTQIYALGGRTGQHTSDQLRSFQVLFITVLPFVP